MSFSTNLLIFGLLTILTKVKQLWSTYNPFKVLSINLLSHKLNNTLNFRLPVLINKKSVGIYAVTQKNVTVIFCIITIKGQICFKDIFAQRVRFAERLTFAQRVFFA